MDRLLKLPNTNAVLGLSKEKGFQGVIGKPNFIGMKGISMLMLKQYTYARLSIGPLRLYPTHAYCVG